MPKPARTVSEQLDLLTSRGLVLGGADPEVLSRMLTDDNYYRLSGYWRYFQADPRNGDDAFVPGASLAGIKTVYEFDRRLRSLLSTGLADLEVTFRSRLAYAVATLVTPTSYLDRAFYSDETARRGGRKISLRDDLITEIRRELSRSREDFIAHHLQGGNEVPIWAAVEALSFGTVSKIYRLCQDDDVRYRVAKSFALDPVRTESALRALVVLRNVCAHHGRVWNRVPTIPLQVPNALKTDSDKSIYRQSMWGLIVTLAWLVDSIRHDTSFSEEVRGLVGRHPELQAGLKKPRRR